MRMFADRHRKDVVGMVLVEPSVEHFEQALAGTSADRINPPTVHQCNVPTFRRHECRNSTDRAPKLPAAIEQLSGSARMRIREIVWGQEQRRTAILEWAGMDSTDSDQVVASRRAYGDMPLVVLTGADNQGGWVTIDGIEAFKSAWLAAHLQMAALSRRGESRLIVGATHQMIFEKPAEISVAIEDVIAASEPK